ncbi:MAG: hypothetical protein HYX20_00660 [Candidatus Yanofskybacteria bacterium]|nr:hypothetical protein [Candidatus Yanofskybacteria bacterium]
MGSTKIIYVLKNDDFDEVFDLFKNAEAEEVIFIFPKGSRFTKQGQYFEAIKQEADSNGCRISVMTADPVIAEYAAQYDIELLQTPEPRKYSRVSEPSDTELNKLEKPEPEEISEVQLARHQFGPSQTDVELAAFKAETRSRIIKDIIRPGSEIERPIKVREEKARPFEVEIKKEISESRNVGNDITQVWASRDQENGKKFMAAANFKKIKSSKIFKKTPLFFIGGAIIVLMLILYATLGNAQVIIKPQKQSLDFQLKVMVSSVTMAADYDLNIIPGQHFVYKDKVSGEFPATGQKNVIQKSSGQITIYNKSFTEQRLVATTRFKSPEGLIFRIPQSIIVPAASKVGDTIKEGSASSIIYADKAGTEYNIGLTTFTIPGFEGSPKYDQFYAKSMAPMSGGIIGPSQVVTEEDFAKAQEELSDKLKEKILRSLKDQAGELKILDSITIKIDLPATNVKTGEAAQTLKITIEGTADTLAFRETDILELISNYVSKKGDLELLEKDLAVNYLNPQTGADGQNLVFEISVTGRAAVRIDQEKVLKDIRGMKENAIRNYLKNMKEVESARVSLSPFWVKSIPKDQTKIKISVEKN